MIPRIPCYRLSIGGSDSYLVLLASKNRLHPPLYYTVSDDNTSTAVHRAGVVKYFYEGNLFRFKNISWHFSTLFSLKCRWEYLLELSVCRRRSNGSLSKTVICPMIFVSGEQLNNKLEMLV